MPKTVKLVDRNGGRLAHGRKYHVGSLSPSDESEAVARMQVVEPGRGPLVLLLPEAREDRLREGVRVDVGAVLVVTVAPEKIQTRAVEGHPGVVDEARVDAQTRAAPATPTFHDDLGTNLDEPRRC